MTDKTSTGTKSYSDIEFDPRFVPEGKDCASCGAPLTSYPAHFCSYHNKRHASMIHDTDAAEVDKALGEIGGEQTDAELTQEAFNLLENKKLEPTHDTLTLRSLTMDTGRVHDSHVLVGTINNKPIFIVDDVIDDRKADAIEDALAEKDLAGVEAGSNPFLEHMTKIMKEDFAKARAASMMAAILGASPSQERSRRISPVEAILSAITKGGVPSDVQESIDRISASPQGQEMLNTKLFEMIFAQDKTAYWHKEILENLVRIEAMLKSSVNIFGQFDLSQSAAYHIEEGRRHIEKAIMILQGVLNPPEKTEKPSE